MSKTDEKYFYGIDTGLLDNMYLKHFCLYLLILVYLLTYQIWGGF